MTREDIARALFSQEPTPEHSWDIQAQPVIVGRMTPDDIWRQALSEAEARFKNMEAAPHLYKAENVNQAKSDYNDLLEMGLFGKTGNRSFIPSTKALGQGKVMITNSDGSYRIIDTGWESPSTIIPDKRTGGVKVFKKGELVKEYPGVDPTVLGVMNPADSKRVDLIQQEKLKHIGALNKLEEDGIVTDQEKERAKSIQAQIDANNKAIDAIMAPYGKGGRNPSTPVGGLPELSGRSPLLTPPTASATSSAVPMAPTNAPIATDMFSNLPLPAEPSYSLSTEPGTNRVRIIKRTRR